MTPSEMTIREDLVLKQAFISMPLKGRPKMRRTPLFIIGVFIVLCLTGIFAGEVQDLLEKANNICLSCMGIG